LRWKQLAPQTPLTGMVWCGSSIRQCKALPRRLSTAPKH
jgi:hypothetical protein